MKTEFIQKRGLNKRVHTLLDNKILVESKTLQTIDKYEVRFDQLGFNIQYQADNTLMRKVVLFISIGIPVIVAILELTFHNIGKLNLLINNFCWLSIAFLAFLKQPQDNIFLVGGEKNLVFYRNIPNEKEVLDFIGQIIISVKSNIKTKYLQYDEFTTDDEYLSRLSWLRETEIISDEECNDLKNDFQIKRLL